MSADARPLPTPAPLPFSTRRGISPTLFWWRLHGLLLIGYAIAGKGFAYLGGGLSVGDSFTLFVGELSLLLALATVLATRAWLRVPRGATSALLLALLLWVSLRTLPLLGPFGVDALRDAAFVGYGFFALTAAGTIAARPDHLPWLIERYRRAVPWLLFGCTCAWLVHSVALMELPRWAGTDVPWLHVKPGDVLVHLAGAAAFLLFGLHRPSMSALLFLVAGFTLAAARGRGGLLAFAAMLGVVFLLRPRSRAFWRAGAAALLALTILAAWNPRFEIAGREFSAQQLYRNARSVALPSSDSGLEGPRSWRLAWWSDIVDYTVFGPHFWTGVGFGVDLGERDGFWLAGASVRNPHNAHATMLARAGVPGLVLWLALQACWGALVLREERRARRQGHDPWARLFGFLLAWWLAFLVNASFDVFLEGPAGGIWFWTLFGVGIGAARVHQRAPHVLLPAAPSSSVSGRAR